MPTYPNTDEILINVDNEYTPLISAPAKTNKCAQYSKEAGKLALALVGLGSIALYIKPAGDCAKLETCGLWLTNLTNEQAATVIFALGGIDFAGISFLQGYLSFDRTVEYIQSQKSTGAKIVKGTGVVIFALSQNSSIVLASIGTHAVPWQTIVTVGGSLSSSLFGTINLIDHDLPAILSKARGVLIIPYHTIIDTFSPLSDHERLRRQQIQHYTKQHSLFIERLETQFRGLVANAASLSIPDRPDPLTFLFQQQGMPETMLQKVTHKAGQFIAPFVAASFVSVLIANTYSAIQKIVPTSTLQIILTTFFSLSQINGNIKITNSAITGPLDSLVNLISHKPINSLSFQLRPKTTTLALTMSMLLSALSYALIDILFENQFPGEDKGMRKGLRIGSMATIDIYHVAGLFHLYQLCLSLLTRDEKEKYLFSLQNKEIPHWKRMSLQDFIAFVESNNPEKNKLFQLEMFHTELANTLTEEPEPTKSRWDSFMHFFGCKRAPTNPTSNAQTAAPMSYQAI